jgi:hypothetical protein
VAGFGELPSFDGIDNRLADAEKEHEKRRLNAKGPSGDVLGAIADNLNNSRIYSSDNKMVAISVSRTFGAQSPNACPYFCWDSFFSGLLASLDDPEMGHQTVRAILSYQGPDGMVPNYAHWNDGGISKDRSGDVLQPVLRQGGWHSRRFSRSPDAGKFLSADLWSAGCKQRAKGARRDGRSCSILG